MRYIALLAFFCFSLSSRGQIKPLLYNVDDLPQTLMSNPGAAIKFKGHIGVPLLSGVHFNAGFTGVSVYDIFRNDDNSDINDRVRNAIRDLTHTDYFSLNEQLEIFSVGWKINRRDYLSAGVYQELDVFSYFPKDIAILANEGNNDYIGVPFDFSQVSFTSEMVTVYHVGLNRKMSNKLRVGGRLKLYSGVFNAESTNNTGFFTTERTPEGPNIFRHYVEHLDLLINTSGFASLNDREDMTVEEGLKELLKRSLLGGNLGIGMDLGFTYAVSDQFKITGAVEDIGIMFQQRDVENYHYYGSYQTDGLEPLFPDLDTKDKAIPYWDIFEDEVNKNLTDETLHKKYMTWRPYKIHTSMQYGFGRAFAPCNYRIVSKKRYLNLVGLQLSGVNRPKGLVYNLTAYYDRKFAEHQRVRFAYTLDDYSFTNLGLMYSSTFKKFNFYLAANNLLALPNLAKARGFSLQLGMQIIFEDL